MRLNYQGRGKPSDIADKVEHHDKRVLRRQRLRRRWLAHWCWLVVDVVLLVRLVGLLRHA